jgi:PEP-CTERM motif
MKNTFSLMRVIALTLWFGLAAGAANAGVPTISGWDGSTDTGYNASFWNTGVSNVFSDWISFSMPADSSGNSQSNVISLGGGGITFSAFNLYENAILIATGIVDTSSSYLSFSGGTTPGNYSLNIAGFKLNPSASASYAGNISISPVPEPETYAMMLAGLGLLGFSIRRRKSDTFD